MTEKRFTYTEQFNGFCDVYDDGKLLSCMRLEYLENTTNLLNEFNDKCEFLEIENEQLKSRVHDLEYQLNYVTKCKEMCFKDIEVLDKDYEKLRKENKELRNDRDYWKILAQSLAKNNGNVKLKDEHLAWKRVDVE